MLADAAGEAGEDHQEDELPLKQ
jgi:hypothetical protein